MHKIIVTFVIFLVISLFTPAPSRAASDIVSQSGTLKNTNITNSNDFDLRVSILKNFLIKYNSPLAEYSEIFIKNADDYQIDWRLVASISGVESTFGRRIPYNSFNAYGWANGKYKFKSWEESIAVVSKALREKYYNRGATNIQKVARRYAPPSDSWAWKVKYFMTKIDSTPVEFNL